MTLRPSSSVAIAVAVSLALVGCGPTKRHDDLLDSPVSGSDSGAHGPDAAPQMISLTTAGGLGSRLVDGNGKALYFYANDVAGSDIATFSGATWPAFFAPAFTVGAGLSDADFVNIGDQGPAQTTWKGRPLYYYENDTANTITGDGIDGLWFVARDYDLFFATSSTITPQGGSLDSPFLTDGAGRSVYVFSSDTRGTGTGAPTSACSPPCLVVWPQWQAPATLTGLALPSTITAANLTSFTNASMLQFVYMGWPLYYYASDTKPGQLLGAGVTGWFTVNGAWNGTLAP
jgi:predicted lipoprotein with Yx(FWY)xxD motif